ncbi:MAG: class I SAM-dependent methyltransferase [Alphaproteobacteria bacterium]
MSMALVRRLADILPAALRDRLRRAYRAFAPAPAEPMMYRVHLFEELLQAAGRDSFRGKRILEIGPRDGLDSKRLAALDPALLVLIDLPEKRALTKPWLTTLPCPNRYIEANFMYMPQAGFDALGRFDLIWCTGVLYHNAEQLRFLRKLYKLLEVGGWLVLESATLRGHSLFRESAYVQIHYPRTYRNTGTVTHLPTAGAVKAWLSMAGFSETRDSRCFEQDNRNLIGIRKAWLARKTNEEGGGLCYAKSGLNPAYKLGDST